MSCETADLNEQERISNEARTVETVLHLKSSIDTADHSQDSKGMLVHLRASE
jgi:hypothetical protein